MRKTLIVLSGMAALAGGALMAQDTTNSGAAGKVATREAAPRGNLEAGDSQATRAPPAGNPANRWRYRFYNRQWWFYHPNNEWSYWNGNAWTPYRRPAESPPAASLVQPYPNSEAANYGFGRRLSGTIQREKNETRWQAGQYFEFREPGSIQREKNNTRWQSLEPLYRPPGTIQSEKNDARAR